MSFTFPLYRAQVELFTSGVPQLSLGERAKLTVTPDYVRNFTLRLQLAILKYR